MFKSMKDKVPEIKHFAYKYLREILTLTALIAAGFSSWNGIFINGFGLSILFTMIGSAIGLIFPHEINDWMHKFYDMISKQNRLVTIGFECIKIIFAFFFAFAYFCWLGFLSATAYHYFAHHGKNDHKHDRAA
jgi:hypothetical protein